MRADSKKLRGGIADERGAALVWVAIWLPVLFLFTSFVLDAGNWWEHRGHLQIQADAAALAGGTEFAFPCNGTTASNIETTARNYGGPHRTEDAGGAIRSFPASQYNAQIGGTPFDKLWLQVNAAEYWNKGGVNYDDGGGPCATNFLDVKLTEQDLPFFIPLVNNLVPAINAHARVQIEQAAAISGSLPLFVRDVNPNSAAALWVSAPVVGSAAPVASRYLDKVDVQANPGACPTGVSCWDNFANPTGLLTVSGAMSTVIALSSLPQCNPPGVVTGCMSLSGSVNAICTQFAVECYWADSSTGAVQAGLVYIRGYPATSTLAADDQPVLGDMRLTGSGTGGQCPDGSFFFIASGSCSVQVVAEVRRAPNYTEADMQVVARGGNCPNAGCPLTYNAVSQRWTGTVPISSASSPPANSISLDWEVRGSAVNMTGKGQCRANFGGSNPCVGTFANVQRAFSGSDPFSGPIREAHVYLSPDTTMPISSLANGSSVQLTAAIRLSGAVATTVSDPPIQLRVVAGSQSAIDCENNVTFREEMTRGCRPLYQINNRLQATDPCDPPYGQNQTDLWNNTVDVPWDCVAVGPGATVGQFTDGLLGRIFNGMNVCTGGGCPKPTAAECALPTTPGRNNWSNAFPNFPAGDPRVVILFMVPFGAFRAQGRALYPISNFGAFYITDWGGNGQDDDPCGTDGTIPTGWLSGHFIKYVLDINSGGGSGPCDPSNTTPCVAVLTQ